MKHKKEKLPESFTPRVSIWMNTLSQYLCMLFFTCKAEHKSCAFIQQPAVELDKVECGVMDKNTSVGVRSGFNTSKRGEHGQITQPRHTFKFSSVLWRIITAPTRKMAAKISMRYNTHTALRGLYF